MNLAEALNKARTLVAAMTEDEKLACLDGDAPFWAGLSFLSKGGYHKRPFHAAQVQRLGVPGFAFVDGPRGVVVDRATCFPVSMARGATWDVDLEERIGEAIGREVRAVGADLYGGVCVNILRHPAWGRAQETYGEDSHHVGELGAALTRGVQRHAMACVKHFAANSMENARFKVDVSMDEQALHEVYLPHFKRIVDEGVAVVMSAYNSVNGEWCGDSATLLTDVLRTEWGFDGFVISDFIFGIRDAATSVTAGLDVEMPYRMIRATNLRTALDNGEVSWTVVDQSITRVLATRLRFDPILGVAADDRAILACTEHRALAREAAAKSVVLLRNELVDGTPVLPLDAGLPSLAVIGSLASAVNLGDGGSSDVWPPEVVTVIDGLRAALPRTHITMDLASAASAHTALVVVGYTYLDEGEFIGTSGTAHLTHLMPGADDPALAASFAADISALPRIEAPAHVAARPEGGGLSTGGDRTSLRLSDADVALITAVAAVNPRTVVAVMCGSALHMSEWDQQVPAIVMSWYSGMEGGHGLADVLLGRVDAGGRLPFSIPTQESHLPPFDGEASAVTYTAWHGWWHLQREDKPAAYPFGYGLSYTTFVLESATATYTDGMAQVQIAVTNTGTRDGSDVVQVYAQREGSDRPRLVAFHRCEVGAGSTLELEISISHHALEERDLSTHMMVVKPGTYHLRVAHHAEDPGIKVKVELSHRNSSIGHVGPKA